MCATRFKFYTGSPLCQSIDFLYTASLNKIHKRFDVVADYSAIEPNERYYLPLSIVAFSNLSPSRFNGDLPVFRDTYLFDRIPEQQYRDIAAGRCFLFIDYSGEAAALVPDIWLDFHSELARRSIDPHYVVIINENHALAPLYRSWCKESDVRPIHIISYNHALYHFSGTINDAQRIQRDRRFEAVLASKKAGALRSRKFVCLNNIPRVHRVALVTYLFDKGFAKKGFYSLLKGLEERYREDFWLDVQALVGERKIARTSYDEILAAVPIEADSAVNLPRAALAGLIGGENIYSDSYVSFVTESNFTSGATLRFTEKILKPIANFQPFLGFGDPGILQLLRSEGFETFCPIIDESYDSIQNPVDRFQALLGEVERLCNMSSIELKLLWSRVWPQLEQNYLQLWDRAMIGYENDVVHDELFNILNS
jgi:hypothetical protein